jgi:DNA-directed RNA polymerase specialized sigma subunit
LEDGKNLTARKGTFMKGQSGNPNGRPKGSKNKITLMKLALEGELRVQMKPHMAEILAAAIQKAKDGDPAMIKLLLDKTLPTTRAAEDDAPAKERVQVVIQALPERTKPVIEGRIINDEDDSGEY